MEFYVETQGLENYSAHEEDLDYIPTPTDRWKFKSGSAYRVLGCETVQQAVARVAFHKAVSPNSEFIEFPLVDSVIDFEEHQAQTIAEYEKMKADGDPMADDYLSWRSNRFETIF